jgi:hypothetical protein
MQIGNVLQQQWGKAGIIYFQARKESTLEYMGTDKRRSVQGGRINCQARWDARTIGSDWS